jgi:hypothetical protein
MVKRPGRDGTRGSTTLAGTLGSGGVGGGAVPGTITPIGTTGGRGGAGGRPSGIGAGTPGAAGYVLLTW